MKKKLLVVCGGQSSEHSISRISCNSVMKHLDKDKYEIDTCRHCKRWEMVHLKAGR